jgi:hypothetical protein
MSKVRINLAVSEEWKQRIDALVEASDEENVTQLLKKALMIYERAIKNDLEGGTLELVDKDGNRKIILL